MSTILDRLLAERSTLLEQCETIANTAQEEERDLSDAEMQLIERSTARARDELTPQIDQQTELEQIRTAHTEALARRVPAAIERHETSAVPAGADENVVYRTFAQYARDEIIRRFDGIAQMAGGPNARTAAIERLDRAVANTISSDVAGLMPTQYMTQIMQVIDTSRPIVDAARGVGLTSGKLSYPSITQRPIVGKQTAEKTEAPSQKMTVTFVDVIADTYVGAGDISWQAINWTTPDALTLWFELAAEQYAIQTEAAAGSVLGAVGTTPIAVASDDLEGWLAAITAAAGQIYSNTRHRADTIFAGITEGYRLIGLASSASPVFVAGGQFSLATGTGGIAGLRLVISPGLPATSVIVANAGSLLAAETAGAPVELRAVEPALGGMEVGIIGAFVAKATEAGAFVPLTPPA